MSDQTPSQPDPNQPNPPASGYHPPATPPAGGAEPSGYPPPGGAEPSGYPPPGGYSTPPAGNYPPPPGGYPAAGPAPYVPPPSVPGQIDIGAAITYAWKKFAANPVPYILLALVSGAAVGIVYALGVGIATAVWAAAYNSYDSTGLFTVAALVGVVFVGLAMMVGLVVNMGLQRAALDTVRGQQVSFQSAFRMDDFKQYLTLEVIIAGGYLVLSVALSFVPFVGSLVANLVLLAAGVLFFFAPYLVLDRKMAAIEALKTSYAMATANIGPVILAVLVIGLISGAGAILCGVGLLATVPLALIAAAFAYVTIQGEQVAP